MFNFKKVLAAVCAIAITATSAISAMAAVKDNYTFGLATGQTEIDDIYTYITLTSDGFTGDDAYTSAGTISYKVTKGVFANAVSMELGRRNNTEGLYSPKDKNSSGADKAATFDVSLNTSNEDYDLLTITWYGAYSTYMTATGNFIDVELEYADITKDAIFTPNNEDSNKFFAAAVDETGALLSSAVTLSENSYKSYKLAAGTNVITEVEEEPTPAATATVVGGFIGDKTEAGNDDEADKTVAILGTPVAPESQATSLVWTVTNTSDVTKTFEQAVDVAGGATYKFGLVLRNITEDLIKTVSAVFAQ